MIHYRISLLHKTGSFRFKKGFKNRRINLTFLFGERGKGVLSGRD